MTKASLLCGRMNTHKYKLHIMSSKLSFDVTNNVNMIEIPFDIARKIYKIAISY